MKHGRMDYLLSYLSELERLNSDGYRCPTEIKECIEWIRGEFASKDGITYELDGVVIARD